MEAIILLLGFIIITGIPVVFYAITCLYQAIKAIRQNPMFERAPMPPSMELQTL